MPIDKFGIPFLYASKPGGFFYQASSNVLNDNNFDAPDGLTNQGGAQSEFTMHCSGPTDFGILKNTGFSDAIGGCDMDFAATETRGYAWKADDVRDIEYKCLVKFNLNTADNGMSISGPTGHHASNSDPCCQGFSYMVTLEPALDPPTFRFRKEMWHVSYHVDPINGEWTHPLVPNPIEGDGKWYGYGYVRYNKKDGRGPGSDSVVVEVWWNPDPESDLSTWTMLKRVEDKGIGWGNDGGDCNGEADQVGTWGSAQSRMKSNAPDGDLHFRCVTLREIDPTLSFDDNPEEPPVPPGNTTEVQGTYKFQWDINTLRSSPCSGVGTGGGGGGTGNAIFYTVADFSDSKELSDSSTFQNRKRVVMSPANSSSVFTGKLPIQLDIQLKAVGTPAASPLVYAKIWSSGGSVIYTSPTTFDPSTFTSSYVSKTFDFSTNTHTLVAGDRIGIEYTGTSSSNYITVGYSGSLTANTIYYQYEGSSWQSKSRSLSMDVWQ